MSASRWGEVGQESCTAHSKAASKTGITVNSVGVYQWKAMLDGLKPNTQYCYRVYLGSGGTVDLLATDASPRFWSQLPAGSAQPFSFAVFGDWGYTGNGPNPDQANLMAQIAKSGARFAFSTGDTAYPTGSQTNYGDLVQTGTNISTVFGPQFWTVAGSSIPLFSPLGNHGLSSTFLVNWPQSRAASTSGGKYQMETYCCLNGTTSKSYPSAWYAFDAGIARFYVLDAAWSNSNVGTADIYKNDFDYHWAPTSAEFQWLESDLASHPSALKFAIFHFPLYSDNATEKSDLFLRGAESLEGLLNQYGVDLAFNGHAHIYQRNLKPHAESVISYLTGGGGGKLAPIGPCSPWDAYGRGWSNSQNKGYKCGAGVPVPTSKSQVHHSFSCP